MGVMSTWEIAMPTGWGYRRNHGERWALLRTLPLIMAAILATACSAAEPARTPHGLSPQMPSATSPPAPAPSGSGSLSGDALWAELRNGTGNVVMLRHTSTEPGTGDPPGFVLTNCATQRNLAASGREEARRIGAQFRSRGVPVQQIGSSRYCRCLETARLLGLGPVTPQPALDSLFENREDTDRRAADLRAFVVAHREQRDVLVLVTHQTNIAAVSGISPRAGEAVVLRAEDADRVAVVGVLPAP
jgi:phosphohistidine phosphatase SixA